MTERQWLVLLILVTTFPLWWELSGFTLLTVFLISYSPNRFKSCYALHPRKRSFNWKGKGTFGYFTGKLLSGLLSSLWTLILLRFFYTHSLLCLCAHGWLDPFRVCRFRSPRYSLVTLEQLLKPQAFLSSRLLSLRTLSSSDLFCLAYASLSSTTQQIRLFWIPFSLWLNSFTPFPSSLHLILPHDNQGIGDIKRGY